MPSLFEILVSLLILSLLLFGLDAVQLTSLRAAKSAYFYSVAIQQMRIANARMQTFGWENSSVEEAVWNKQNSEVLPHGVGRIANHTISLSWRSEVNGTTQCLSLKQ